MAELVHLSPDHFARQLKRQPVWRHTNSLLHDESNAPNSSSAHGKKSTLPKWRYLQVSQTKASFGFISNGSSVSHPDNSGRRKSPKSEQVPPIRGAAVPLVYSANRCGSRVRINESNYMKIGFICPNLPGGSLTTFDPPGSTNTQPQAINLAGTIMGNYTDASGNLHGFLRIPAHQDDDTEGDNNEGDNNKGGND
jgi:hypothetical protein